MLYNCLIYIKATMNLIMRIMMAGILVIAVVSQPVPTITDNCLSLSAAGSCVQCAPGFYLQYFLCLPCAPLCQCSSQYNYCQSCVLIQYQSYNISIQPFAMGDRCYFCDSFIQNCLTCNSSNVCTSCYGGYYVVQGSLISGNEFSYVCSLTTCQNNCQICENSNDCSICQESYYLDNITKRCSLSICQNNCTLCLTQSKCNICSPGYYLQSDSTCQNCSIQNCISCDNTTSCLICDIGYFLSDPTTCLSTGVSNCIVYLGGASQATGCQVCQPGYFVLNSNCNQCVGCNFCSLQFLCQSPCYANTTAFNYACLTAAGSLHVSEFSMNLSLWLCLFLLLSLWLSF